MDPVTALKRELLAAAERQQARGVPARSRRLVALGVAALVVAVGTASAFGTVRDFLDRGFVGLPPEGATPSTPERGELVLHWEGRSASHARRFGAPLVRAWVYADGRVVWSREGPIPEGANEFFSGYLEQRLTDEGVELLRSAVTELLDASGALVQTVPAEDSRKAHTALPGGDILIVPLDYRSLKGFLEVPSGDRLARLTWGDPSRWRHARGATATTEQLEALRRVDALVTHPASVLPSSAWAVREIRSFVPSHYDACIVASPPKDFPQLLSLLPAPAAALLRGTSPNRSEGEVFPRGGAVGERGQWVEYCSKLSTEDARELAESLPDPDDPDGFRGLVQAVPLAAGSNWWEKTTLWFDPYLPHGAIACTECLATAGP